MILTMLFYGSFLSVDPDLWLDLQKDHGEYVFSAKVGTKPVKVGIFLGQSDASLSDKHSIVSTDQLSLIGSSVLKFSVKSRHSFSSDLILGRNSFKNKCVVLDFARMRLGVLSRFDSKDMGRRINVSLGQFSSTESTYWLPSTLEYSLVKQGAIFNPATNLDDGSLVQSAEDGVAASGQLFGRFQVFQGSNSDVAKQYPIPGVSFFGLQQVCVDFVSEKIYYSDSPKPRCAWIVGLLTGFKLSVDADTLKANGHSNLQTEKQLSQAGFIPSNINVSGMKFENVGSESDFESFIKRALQSRFFVISSGDKKAKFEF